MTVSQIPQPQLTLNFEPSAADEHKTLRAFIAYTAQQQVKSLKSIAADMDMAPSTLSRKLTAGLAADDKDTQRFNVDDLEHYMQATGDTSPIEYLAAKFLYSDTHRKARLLAKAERLATEYERALRDVRNAA